MPHKGVGQSVTRQGLADVMGVAPTTVDTWRRRGCPAEKKGGRGKSWSYNTADVLAWIREQDRGDAKDSAPTSEDEARLRKLIAEAEQKELELARSRAEVAPVDEIERMVAMAFAEVRSHLRNLPSRVVTSLLGETSERKFKRILLAEIDQALEALADAELIEDGE